MTEEQSKDVLVSAISKQIKDRNSLISDCWEITQQLTDCTEINAELQKVQAELSVHEELLRRLIEQNAREAMDQEEYNSRYASLDERYRQYTDRYEQLTADKQHRLRLHDDMKQFIESLKYADIVTDFHPEAWYALAECITVHAKDDIRVTFRNGTTI